jgi:hypothetical protein
MKKIIFCLIILFSVSTIAYAEEILEGRPGRYEMSWAQIEVYDTAPLWCAAYYADPVELNDAIGNQTDTPPGEDPNIKFVKVVINKKRVMAICKFTDESPWYEANAEVGKIILDEGIPGCTLITDDCFCEGGTGHITAAANHGEYDPYYGFQIGATVTLKCTFDLEDCNFPD